MSDSLSVFSEKDFSEFSTLLSFASTAKRRGIPEVMFWGMIKAGVAPEAIIAHYPM